MSPTTSTTTSTSLRASSSPPASPAGTTAAHPSPAAQRSGASPGSHPHRSGSATCGTVAFVGAGPGDPGLLTLRGAELLAAADMVVHDGGAWDVIRRHCRGDVEVIGPPTGTGDSAAEAAQPKAPGEAEPDGGNGSEAARPEPAEPAIRLATNAALEGRSVVRVFDGDPGLLGGLVEEATACTEAGVPFEIVPGVPAETAVPAYAGIPLTTERGTDVRIIAGGLAGADLSAAAEDGATLVFLGTVEELPRLVSTLITAGRLGSTPIAVTQGGTTTSQSTLTSTLAQLPTALKGSRLTGQAVTVVGEAVPYRNEISWFETKPLFGWRVLVPRTREQAAALSVQLRDYGAVPHEVPTIAVEPPRTPQQMERAVNGLVNGRYKWIAFTSTNAVRAVREKFEEYGLDARAFAGIKVAAVGEQTAAALLAFGIKPDLVPSGEQSAAGLLKDWPPYDKLFDPIDRVFLPRADIATEALVAGLIELGWEVDDVTAYRTVRAAPPPAETREAIKSGGFDAVLFTSSSTVRNLVGIAGKPHASTVIACIGQATAKTAEEHGLRVDVLSPTPSTAALARALADFGAARRQAAIAAGEPVLRPSERRAASRRRVQR